METKKRNPLVTAIRTIAFVALFFAAGYVIFWVFTGRNNKRVYDEAAAQYVKIVAPEESGETDGGEGQSGSGELKLGVKTNNVEIDFEGLWEVNRDVYAWIQMPDIYCMDYPVVWRTDEYYLERTWKGVSSPYGSIFIEESNNPDFTDYHTILYGHRMVDRTMFGWIEEYLKQSYYDTHKDIIYIYTPEGRLTYQIFSVEEVNHSDPIVYTVGFCPSPQFEEFVQGMVERSQVETGVSATVNDRILTLSTCAFHGKDRLVVHAKLIDGYLLNEDAATE